MIFFLSYYDSILSWLISDVWIMDLSVVFSLREKSTMLFQTIGHIWTRNMGSIIPKKRLEELSKRNSQLKPYELIIIYIIFNLYFLFLRCCFLRSQSINISWIKCDISNIFSAGKSHDQSFKTNSTTCVRWNTIIKCTQMIVKRINFHSFIFHSFS